MNIRLTVAVNGPNSFSSSGASLNWLGLPLSAARSYSTSSPTSIQYLPCGVSCNNASSSYASTSYLPSLFSFSISPPTSRASQSVKPWPTLILNSWFLSNAGRLSKSRKPTNSTSVTPRSTIGEWTFMSAAPAPTVYSDRVAANASPADTATILVLNMSLSFLISLNSGHSFPPWRFHESLEWQRGSGARSPGSDQADRASGGAVLEGGALLSATARMRTTMVMTVTT